LFIILAALNKNPLIIKASPYVHNLCSKVTQNKAIGTHKNPIQIIQIWKYLSCPFQLSTILLFIPMSQVILCMNQVSLFQQ